MSICFKWVGAFNHQLEHIPVHMKNILTYYLSPQKYPTPCMARGVNKWAVGVKCAQAAGQWESRGLSSTPMGGWKLDGMGCWKFQP